MDAGCVDLLSPPPSPQRSRRDSSDEQSPSKAALLSTPPRSSGGLARTPRDPAGTNSATTSPVSESPLHSSVSSLSNVSEKNLGQLVEQQCGKSDNRYASRMGVVGAVSSDESSISGSFRSSGLASGSSSQPPSLYSTGSHHPHPTPNDAEIPLCVARHAMQFGRFTQANHCCDNPDCNANIVQGAWGWHCVQCVSGFDYCSECFPHTWDPLASQESTLHDSLSTMQLSSPSPSPLAAPCHQRSASAAAAGRGHDD